MEPSLRSDSTHLISSEIRPRKALTLAATNSPTCNFRGISPEQASHSPSNQKASVRGQIQSLPTVDVSNGFSNVSSLDQRSKHNRDNILLSPNSFAGLDRHLDASSRQQPPLSSRSHYRSQSVQPQAQGAETITNWEQIFADQRTAALMSRSSKAPQLFSPVRHEKSPDWQNSSSYPSKSYNPRREPELRSNLAGGTLPFNSSNRTTNLPPSNCMHTVNKSRRLHRASTVEPVSINRNMQILAWLAEKQKFDPCEISPQNRRKSKGSSLYGSRTEILPAQGLEITTIASKFHKMRSTSPQIRGSSVPYPGGEWMSVNLSQCQDTKPVIKHTLPSKRDSPNHDIWNRQLKRQRRKHEDHQPDLQSFVENSNGYSDVQERLSIFEPSTMDLDTQRHRESIPQDWSAPAPLKIESYLKNGKVNREMPDIISLISSNDSIPEVLPIERSIPVEYRRESAKEASVSKKTIPLRSPGRSESIVISQAKFPKEDLKIVSDEEQRQKRAAIIILGKEDDALAQECFGEAIKDEKEKKESLARERAEIQARNRAKEIEAEAQRDAKIITEMQRQRETEEKAEILRLMKEGEESKKKKSRDTKRLEDEAVFEKVLDEKRRAAVEKIEADRLKREASQATRALEGRYRKIQVEKDALQSRKISQDIAKRQAASLRPAKLPSVEDFALQDDEDSLFVHEDIPKREGKMLLKEVQSASKPKGPRNAAEVFAQSTTKSSISSYRADKEATEKQSADEKVLDTQTRFKARQKAFNESCVARNAARLKRIASRVHKSSTLNCKSSKASGFIIDDFGDDSDDIATSVPLNDGSKCMPVAGANAKPLTSSPAPEPISMVTQLQLGNNHLASSFNGCDTSVKVVKSTPSTLLSKKFASSVKLLSDIEQGNIEKQSLAGVQKTGKKRTELQKIARKKKYDKIAKEKQRQRLIEAANQCGAEISENMLDIQVEAFMEKREKELQRRKESRNIKQAHDNSKSDSISTRPLRKGATDALNLPTAEIETDNEDNDHDSIETRQLKAENRARKKAQAETSESLRAFRKVRGIPFSETARTTQLAEFESDSEVSEEDPDEYATPISNENVFPFKSSRGQVDVGKNCDNNTGGNLDHEHNYQVFTESRASLSSANTSFGSDLTFKPKPDLVNKGPIHVYTVHQLQIIEGKDQEPEVVEHFLSLEDANACAQNHTETVRQQYQRSFPSIKSTFEDKMYNSQLWYDESEQNGLYVEVARHRQAVKDVANFDPVAVPQRLPEKSWLLKQTTTRVVEATEEKLAQEIRETIIVPKFHYSNLIDANHAACIYALKFLQPKQAKIEHVFQHVNDLGKELREARDWYTDENQTFYVEIEVGDENSCWMKPLREIIFDVEAFEMMGPTN